MNAWAPCARSGAAFASGCAMLVCGCAAGGVEPVPVPAAALESASEERPVPGELFLVATARGLAAPSSLDVERVSRSELLRIATQEIAEQAPPEVLAERSRVLIALGLAPPGFDLALSVRESLRLLLVGLYDPDADRVLVVDDVDAALERSTLLHELAHGVVDHHFGLSALLAYRAGEGDRVGALLALAEGDATSLGLDLESELDAPRREQLLAEFWERTRAADGLGIPRVVQCFMSAPYREGLSFVETLRARGGWSAVNAAWRDPPLSTEQLRDVERYDAREPPIELPESAAPEAGCRELYRDRLGASTLGCIFAEWVGDTKAADVLDGWGGDRVATFDCPSGAWVELALKGDDREATERILEVLGVGLAGAGCLDPSWEAQVGGEASSFRIRIPPDGACATLARVPPDRAISGSPEPR